MWYRLRNEVDRSIMGDYPQTEEYVNEALIFLNEIKDLLFTDHLEGEYTVNYIRLKPKTILTDFISCSKHQNSGLIISKKVYDILNGFKIYNCKFYDTVLQNKKNEFHYYFMRLAGNLTDYIDFDKSVFRIHKNGKVVKEFKCISKQDYYDKRIRQSKDDVINPIYPHEIYFHPDFYKLNYDGILLGDLNSTAILINEKVKEKLEKENITGMIIEPFEMIKN